jgi:hypothetical protein
MRRRSHPTGAQRVEAARDRVVAPGGGLDQQRHPGLQHLEHADPAAHPLLDTVLGMAGVDDHRRRIHVRRRLAG